MDTAIDTRAELADFALTDQAVKSHQTDLLMDPTSSLKYRVIRQERRKLL